MSEVEAKLKSETEAANREAIWSPKPHFTAMPRKRRRVLPVLLTVLVAAVAVMLGRVMWTAYMGTPWTRDATVRAYVVKMAPEVAGRIIELPVDDNQFVHKDELLMAVDPTDYKIAVSEAEAAVQQAQANVQNIEAQMTVQQAQISANQAQLDRARAALVYAQQQAGRYQNLAQEGWGSVQSAQQTSSQLRQQEVAVQAAVGNLDLVRRQVESLKAQHMGAEGSLAQAKAQLNQAQVNLERTRIVSPVDGYVTNLLAQRGDYVNIGLNTVSVIDANSFWVDGYFEETNLRGIREGDPATVKLMGHSEAVRGHVESIARGINVPNAQPDPSGLASVNPIFTWIRLAQRVPVRIHLDDVPSGVKLVAGMTATVQIDHESARQPNLR